MFCWMMLACIIGSIVYAAMPKVNELVLCIVAFEPMEVLIHQFRRLWSLGAHGEALGSDVVGGDHGAFELWTSHFFESCANGGDKFAAVVECSQFRFGS
jgi:hypothetical protein